MLLLLLLLRLPLVHAIRPPCITDDFIVKPLCSCVFWGYAFPLPLLLAPTVVRRSVEGVAEDDETAAWAALVAAEIAAVVV